MNTPKTMRSLRRLAAALGVILSTAIVPIALAAPCAGFTDVDDASGFCPNVDWLKNRRITLGCTSATAYCPADPVSRLAMAAFMNRLGTALTPAQFPVDVAPGAIDLDLAPVVCQTQDVAVLEFPRRAYVDLSFNAMANADLGLAADIVMSSNGGASWTNLNTVANRGFVPANQWGTLSDLGFADLTVGQTVRWGVRTTRGGIAGRRGRRGQPLRASRSDPQPQRLGVSVLTSSTSARRPPAERLDTKAERTSMGHSVLRALTRSLQRMAAPGLALVLALHASPSHAASCAGFTDVEDSSPFCNNVQWLKNRSITLGCSATSYCPSDGVIRLQMAAFMNRLGTALTPIQLPVDAAPGGVDLDAAPVVCQTDDFAAAGFARTAYADVRFSAKAGAPVGLAADLVMSTDGGASWATLNLHSNRGSVPANQWGTLNDIGFAHLDAAQSARWGVRLTRGGIAGATDLADSRCQLRVRLYSGTLRRHRSSRCSQRSRTRARRGRLTDSSRSRAAGACWRRR